MVGFGETDLKNKTKQSKNMGRKSSMFCAAKDLRTLHWLLWVNLDIIDIVR